MGSNIANTPLIIIGLAGLLYFVRTDWRIGRGQGTVAVVSYAAFLAAAFLPGWE